jgi:hypothetical protein
MAEAFRVEGSVSQYRPGDVLVISTKNDRHVKKSSQANSTSIAGVYATKPGVLLTERNVDASHIDTIPVGVIGVIPTHVCTQNGPIRRGDLLVTSNRSGCAMKAKAVRIGGMDIYPTGAIIGRALENYTGTGIGKIRVLVNAK